MRDRGGRLARWTRVVPLGLGAALALIVAPGAGRADAPPQQDEAEEKGAVGIAGSDWAVRLGGQYRVVANASNFEFHPAALTDRQESLQFVNQRLRTWLNLHDRTERRHGVYLQVEIGHVAWGDDGEFPKTHQANGAEVGLELRRAYLWYKPTPTSLLRAGILDWHDRFGERPSFRDPQWAVDAYDSFYAPLASSIWDFNVGGVTFDATVGDGWHYGVGAMVLQQDDRTLGGDGSALLVTGDLDKEAGGALWGASLYYLRDRGGYVVTAREGEPVADGPGWELWTGVRGHLAFGRLRPSFFNNPTPGRRDGPSWEHTGWAAKAAAEVDTAPGTLRLQFLYSTGNDGSSASRSDEFRTIAQSARDGLGAQTYWSLLGLSSPRGPSDVLDLGVGLQNRGLGLLTIQAGWERRLTDRLAAYAAAGWLRAAEASPRSGARDLGIEILGELRFGLARAMGIDVGVSYFSTGDFYRTGLGGPPPDDLYEVYLRYQLEL